MQRKRKIAITMAKKDEKLEAQQAAEAASAAPTPSATPNYDAWGKNMRGKYGEDKTDEELYELSMKGYDEAHEAAKRYNAEADEFAARVAENPEIGAIFAGILDRSLTDENIADNETLSTYADRKKKKDEEAAEEAKKAQLDEMRAKAFEEVCAEDNVADPEAALQSLQAVFENPCETLEQCKEQARAFLKMVDFDSAVQAAEVRGRNANISAQRKKNAGASDGQANRASAAAVPTQGQSTLDAIAADRAKYRDF